MWQRFGYRKVKVHLFVQSALLWHAICLFAIVHRANGNGNRNGCGTCSTMVTWSNPKVSVSIHLSLFSVCVKCMTYYYHILFVSIFISNAVQFANTISISTRLVCWAVWFQSTNWYIRIRRSFGSTFPKLLDCFHWN